MKAPTIERPGNLEGVPSFRSQLPPIFFLVEIFFLNFMPMIGAFGQAKSFSSGFMILGGVLAGGALLVRYLKFVEA